MSFIINTKMTSINEPIPCPQSALKVIPCLVQGPSHSLPPVPAAPAPLPPPCGAYLGQSLLSGEPILFRLAPAKPLPALQKDVESGFSEKVYNLGKETRSDGWLKKMFKGIGRAFKKVGQVALGFVKGVLNPRNWIRPAFWRDVIAPLALSLIPGLGPLVGTAYRWGMAAYHGVKTVTSLAKGRFLEALSHAGSALTGVAGLGAGALSRGAARAKRWLDTGVAYYRQAEAFLFKARTD